MGVPIPHDLFRPICIGGKLTFDRTEMPSAQNAYSSMTSRAAGSWSNAVLLNNGVDNGVNKGETLLYIVMSVFECLIYSYSSYPWGNNYNDLAGQVMTHRNYGNWLSYPLQTNTLLGNVVKQAAPIFVNTIGPAINTVLPGVGTAISGVISKGAQSESANQQPQLINPAETTQLAPGGVGSSGGMSPIIIVAIVAIGLFILLRK